MATPFNPGPVPREALDYFRAKDLRVGFSHQDVWGQEHAHAFTVAKAMRVDILDDIRAAADQALANGETFRAFANNITPKLGAKGWWGVKEVIDPATGDATLAQLGSPRRLKTIYDANMRSARAAGQWERAQRTKRALPYLLYELGPSEEHREEHVRWAGIILPVDDPFWRTHMPPNGYGCKCRVRQISQVEYDRLKSSGNYLTEAPPERPKRFVNKRTGEITRVDRGLDPSWAGNPGQDRVRVIREQLVNKLHSADQQMSRAAVRSVMDSPLLEQWMEDREGQLAVAILDRDLQRAMGAQSQTVRLSTQTLDKQSRSHAELTAEHYRQLPALIDGAIAIAQGGNRLALFRQVENSWQKAVVKVTGDGRQVYLVSYHKSDASELQRLQRNGRVIRSVAR